VTVIDPDYAAEVVSLDRKFIEEYERGSSARRQYLRDNQDVLVAGYERLAEFIERNRAALEQRVGREVPLVARQEARSMVAYVRQQAASEMKDYAEIRDRAMADNVLFLLEELFPGEKVIVWGHNYHVRHDGAAIPPREEIFPGVADPVGWQLDPRRDVLRRALLEVDAQLLVDLPLHPSPLPETAWIHQRHGPSAGAQHELDGSGDALPEHGLLRQLLAPRPRQRVELRPAVVVGLAPFRGDPTLPFHAVEGGVERTLLHHQNVLRTLLDPARHVVAVLPPLGEDLQDQQVQGALQ
jgi:hypothetical protein